jgi:hypothetical protein
MTGSIGEATEGVSIAANGPGGSQLNGWKGEKDELGLTWRFNFVYTKIRHAALYHQAGLS